MSVFDDFEAFGFEGEDYEGDGRPSESQRERRKKYFEEELRRHREEKRRKLSTEGSGAGDGATHADPPERQFLNPEILEELVDYCIENEKFEEALDFALLLTERAPFN